MGIEEGASPAGGGSSGSGGGFDGESVFEIRAGERSGEGDVREVADEGGGAPAGGGCGSGEVSGGCEDWGGGEDELGDGGETQLERGEICGRG